MSKVERRIAFANFEVRDQGEEGMVTVAGLAAATGKPYVLWSSYGGEYREEIMPGAFSRTLSRNPDVSLLVEHKGLPLARTTNRTMKLWESGRGLEIEARIDKADPDVAGLLPKMRTGAVNEMSISFRVEDGEKWKEGKGHITRQITELDMDRLDVSVVRAGANPHTSVNLRSMVEAESGAGSEPQMAPSADGQHVSAAEAEQLEIPTSTPTQPAATVPAPEESSTDAASAAIVETDSNSQANPDENVADNDDELWTELFEKTGAIT